MTTLPRAYLSATTLGLGVLVAELEGSADGWWGLRPWAKVRTQPIHRELFVMAYMANRRGEIGNSDIFLGSKITVVTAAMKFKDTCFLEGKL